MSTSELEASPEILGLRIRKASEELGSKMDTAIPLRPSRLGKIISLVQFSERILVPDEDEKGVYTRAWLERKATRKRSRSPIELLTDTVEVDDARENQFLQVPQDPLVAAVYDFNTGLDIVGALETSQEETLERIIELGTYVADITEAKVHKELLRVVPVH